MKLFVDFLRACCEFFHDAQTCELHNITHDLFLDSLTAAIVLLLQRQ